MSLIDKEWSPKEVEGLKDKINQVKIKVKPDLTTDEISRMQHEVIMLATEMTWPINQCRFYEAKMAREKTRAFTQAFLTAVGSDRKREQEAKASGDVRIAEAKAQEAEVYRKLLEDLKDDLLKIHYSLKAALQDQSEERRYT